MKRLMGMGAIALMACGLFALQLTAGGEVLRQAGQIVQSGEMSVLARAGGTAITAMASVGARHASGFVAGNLVSLARGAVQSPALSGVVAFHEAPQRSFYAFTVPPTPPQAPQAFEVSWESLATDPQVVVQTEQLQHRIEVVQKQAQAIRRVVLVRHSI